MIRLDKDNRQFRLGAIFLAGLALALGGTALFQGIDLGLDIGQRLQSPGAEHLLGTDALGRDILSCLAFGALTSVAIALAVVALAAAVGAGLGFLAGWHGGLLGACIMRGADFILAFPGILLALALVAFWGQGVLPLILALALTGWVSYARLVRGEVLKIKGQDYILAARGFNARRRAHRRQPHPAPGLPRAADPGRFRDRRGHPGRSQPELPRPGAGPAPADPGRDDRRRPRPPVRPAGAGPHSRRSAWSCSSPLSCCWPKGSACGRVALAFEKKSD